MDLGTVWTRLESGVYTTAHHVRSASSALVAQRRRGSEAAAVAAAWQAGRDAGVGVVSATARTRAALVHERRGTPGAPLRRRVPRARDSAARPGVVRIPARRRVARSAGAAGPAQRERGGGG